MLNLHTGISLVQSNNSEKNQCSSYQNFWVSSNVNRLNSVYIATPVGSGRCRAGGWAYDLRQCSGPMEHPKSSALFTIIYQKEGENGSLCHFQQRKSYRDEIETRNREGIPFSPRFPICLLVAEGPIFRQPSTMLNIYKATRQPCLGIHRRLEPANSRSGARHCNQ